MRIREEEVEVYVNPWSTFRKKRWGIFMLKDLIRHRLRAPEAPEAPEV
jgi:hypothetical protein